MSLLRSFYVDAPSEIASQFVLSKLGVESSVNGKDNNVAPNTTFNIDEFNNEHKLNTDLTFTLIRGSASIDIRDTSNSWIRIELDIGRTINIAGSLYRKFQVTEDVKFALSFTSEPANPIYRFAEHLDSIELTKYHSYRELVCELCRQFFTQGWVTGTGGSISIKYGSRIYMTPSGVQKERINPDELFVLDVSGNILSVPNKKPDFVLPKLSDCAPLFLHAYQQRNAG